MFTTSEMCESSQPAVTLNGIDPDAMSELIDYAYTGNIAVKFHFNLFSALFFFC